MATTMNNIIQSFVKVACQHQIYRSMSLSTAKSAKTLIYSGYGEPVDVLKITDMPNDKPKTGEVVVKWLLAPVNPADINTIQGKYPSRPPLPAVPGNEGVGEVIEVGPGVQEFNVGDRVVPNLNNNGTWRTHATYSTDSLFKVYCHFVTKIIDFMREMIIIYFRFQKILVQLKLAC